MKKILIIMLMTLVLGVFCIPGASAADPVYTIAEDGWKIYIDGSISDTGYLLPMDFSGVSTEFSFTNSGLASEEHTGIVFYDAEIDQTINTWFNEYGNVFNIGSLPSGLMWEIDEPGYIFGNIYTHFEAGTLDNTVFDGAFTGPEDVSMAMGWKFDLAPGRNATLKFSLSDEKPASGFYLAQSDPDSLVLDDAGNPVPATLYYTSTLNIKDNIPGVPEPGTLILLGLGLFGLVGVGRRVKL